MSKLNKIVKSYPDLDGYSPFIIQDIPSFDATNFNYADGIATRGFEKGSFTFITEKIPDYAIIVDETNKVTSRWYVDECIWKSYGAWHIHFYRDVLSDYREAILGSTVLIEKATVSENDPAIYNQEAVTFNQIKKSEKLLKDATETAWLVGYLSSDNSAEKTFSATSSNLIRRTVHGLQNWEMYTYINNDFIGAPKNISYNIKIGKLYLNNNYNNYMQYAFNRQGPAVTDTIIPAMGYAVLTNGDYAYNVEVMFNSNYKDGGSGVYTSDQIAAQLNTFLPGEASNFDASFIAQANFLHTEDEEGALKDLEGTTIYDSEAGKAYKVHVIKTSSDSVNRYKPTINSTLWLNIKNAVTNSADRVFYANPETYPNDKALYVKYTANKYRISLSEITVDQAKVTITSSRLLLNDAPYTMFAIPYSGISFKVGSSTYTSQPAAAVAIAREISIQLMSSKALYDLQLLPYCPRQDLIGSGFIDLRSSAATEHTDYELIKDENDNTIKSFMIYGKESSFTFDINEAIQITEKKIQNQVDMWRICSPNYNGVFEFNAAKNNGVDYFNVDCTYRPYNPYIHINPNFKELYGNDYDDARGLICSGDFSMPACTDKWLEYEAQNKNYQNSFDRQIQHMEIEQKYQRISQIAGAVTGVAQGVIAGGIATGGNPIGAIAGGVVSAGAGVADIVMSEKLRQEQISYAKDQFAFSLENIRALPNTLAKISAFNKNNKIFPFLEYYTCTDIERQAFRDMLKYDGMTVNRIGKIQDYLKDNDLQYIKARLIRTDLHEDTHVINVIAAEMAKGAYYDTRSD